VIAPIAKAVVAAITCALDHFSVRLVLIREP
jgi:hypothetical protein